MVNSAKGKPSSEFIAVRVAVPYRASVTPSSKQIFEAVTLYHKNCWTIENQKSTNFSVKKLVCCSPTKRTKSNTFRNGPH